MAKQKKYHKGDCIPNIGVLAVWLESNQWTYWGDRPKHPGWIISMSLQTLLGAIRAGRLRFAIRNMGDDDA